MKNHPWFWLQHLKFKLHKFWLVRYIYNPWLPNVLTWYHLHISEFESNTFHDLDTCSFFHFFLWVLHLLQFGQMCIWGYLYALEKPKICIKLNFFETACESLHMLVSRWFFFCGQVWSTYFKLVYSTICRNSFQPKYVMNSEWR